MTMAYHRQQGVNTCISRTFNTYGSRMKPTTGGRSRPLRQALQDKPLTVFGDGSQTRSFCYVDDQIRGLVALAESDVHLPVNIGSQDEYTLLQLAETVIEVARSRSRSSSSRFPSTIPRSASPTSPGQAAARLRADGQPPRRPEEDDRRVGRRAASASPASRLISRSGGADPGRQGAEPRDARRRSIRDPEPLGRGDGEDPRRPRIQGSRRRAAASPSPSGSPTAARSPSTRWRARRLDRRRHHDLSVSVDLENGHGPAPEDAAQAITRGGGRRRGRVVRGLTVTSVDSTSARRSSGSRPRSRPLALHTFPSPSQPAPRTTSATTPTSTTRSLAFGPTRRRARTSSTPRGSTSSRTSRPSATQSSPSRLAILASLARPLDERKLARARRPAGERRQRTHLDRHRRRRGGGAAFEGLLGARQARSREGASSRPEP